MILNFFIAINTENGIITKLKVIALNYLKKYFVVDLLSSLPGILILEQYHIDPSDPHN